MNANQQSVLNAVSFNSDVAGIAAATGFPVPSVRGYVLGLAKAGLVTYKDGVVSLVKQIEEVEVAVTVNSRKKRQPNPNSTRQVCVALAKRRIANGTHRKTIVAELIGEFQLGANLAGRYWQQAREALGLVHKKETVA